jgi:hypothetical protein
LTVARAGDRVGGEDTVVPVDLSPDALVADLAGEQDVVPLAGFVGQVSEGRVRLFVDPELKVFFDIPEEHVRRRQRFPAESGRYGEWSVIWVNGAWIRQPLFTDEQRERLARDFLIGPFALELSLPETIADAVHAAAREVRKRTTYHSGHCRQ